MFNNNSYKNQVLTAMSQGETLIKALHDALPEDVRGKITDAVSGILRAQGANLKLNRIQDIGHIPNVTPMLKSKNEEAVSDISGLDASSNDNQHSDQKPKAETSGSEDVSLEDCQLKRSSELELELHSSGKSASSFEEETKGNTGESGKSFESEEFSEQKTSDSAVPSSAETSSDLEEAVGDALTDSVTKEGPGSQKSGESLDSMLEEKNMAPPKVVEDIHSSSGLSPEVPPEKDKSDDQKKENKSMISAPASSTTSFSVTEALDALTGMDDSTQVAVNSVFGVLEEMITQLEEVSVDENGDGNGVDDKEASASLQKHEGTDSDAVEKKALKESGADSLHNARNGGDGEKLVQSSEGQDDVNGLGKRENTGSTRLVNSRRLDSNNNVAKLRLVNGIPFHAIAKSYGSLLRDEYMHRYLFSKLPTKSLDMDTTATLLLDYIPEEGQWKLLEQPGNNADPIDSVATNGMGINSTGQEQSSAEEDLMDNFIETPYVVMDTGGAQPPVREYAINNRMEKQADVSEMGSFQLIHFIKKIILDSLKVEVDRRTNVEDKMVMEPSLAVDCEIIANAVCSAISCDEELALDLKARTYSIDHSYKKIGTLHGDVVVGALTLAVQETSYLKRLLPVGVVVGSCLAALREFFDVVSEHDNVGIERDITDGVTDRANNFSKSAMKEMVLAEKSQNKSHVELNKEDVDHLPDNKSDEENSGERLKNGGYNGDNKETHSRKVMVGVVTAALGTSAFLVKQQVENTSYRLTCYFFCSFCCQGVFKFLLPIIIFQTLL